jgi:sulfotransferase
MKVENQIYVSGLPRAMSTLMCNVLANNPKIVGGETSPLLEYVFGARANFSSVPEVKSALTAEIMERSFLDFCSGGMISYANSMIREVKPEATVYLDKSRGWIRMYDLLEKINDTPPKIIVMVRDLRAVVASMEKKWRDNPQVMDSRDNSTNMDFQTLDNRVNHFLNDHPLGLALGRLYDAVATGTIKNMLVVRAEDFCMFPEKTMKAVYKYIDELYYEMDYSNVQQVTVENDRVGDFGIYGDHIIRNDIQPISNDYKEILGKDICQNIKTNFAWFYNEFKYFN